MHFGFESAIDKELINKLIEIRQREGATNATVNRYFTLLRAVLNRAKNEWEWIDQVPKLGGLMNRPLVIGSYPKLKWKDYLLNFLKHTTTCVSLHCQQG